MDYHVIREDDPFTKFENELEKAKVQLRSSLEPNQGQPDSTDSHLSIVVKQLKEKLHKVESDNRRLNKEIKELNESKEHYKSTAKALESRVSADVRDIDALRSGIRQRDVVIEKLAREVERRDKIFELSMPTIKVGNEVVREENEVTMDMSPGGHRTYEIKQKQKVPFWIKEERLSPRVWEKLTCEALITEEVECFNVPKPVETSIPDDDLKFLKAEKIRTEEPQDNASSSGESDFSRFEAAKIPNGGCATHSPKNKKVRSRFRSRSNSSERQTSKHSTPTPKKSSNDISNDLPPDSRHNDIISQSPTPSTSSRSRSLQKRVSSLFGSPERSPKVARRSDKDSVGSRASSEATTRSSTNSFMYTADQHSDSMNEQSVSLVSVNNVLEIPEVFRINFSCLENTELEDCPYAKHFWYDEEHAGMTKYLLRLYNDSGNLTKKRVHLKEQLGLAPPKSFFLKFHILRKRVENTRNKRVWLDIRDWDIFSVDNRETFRSIERDITHFSFGANLYSPDQLRANLLFEYILNHLHNLEFLSINDCMLRKLDRDVDPDVPPSALLPRLKTLRLVSYKFKFSTPFIMKFLDRAPALENLYGLPLHCLPEIESTVSQINLEGLKSVQIVRARYSGGEVGGDNFLQDLTTLARRPVHTLEELDSRTFFVSNTETRSRCMDLMKRILRLNDRTLKKVKLEPCGRIGFLEIPQLNFVETLQFDMKRMATGIRSFFPREFNIAENFPNVINVDIALDAKSGKTFSTHNPIGLNHKYGADPLDLFLKHFPPEIFEPGVTFVNVQRLFLNRFTPFEAIESFSLLFPNIKVLRLSNTLADISDILPLCFGFWPRLQQLILEVNTDTKFGNLDAALTGIDQEKCGILAKARIQPELEQIQKWIRVHRTKLSICHLTELHLLRFVVRSPFGSEPKFPIFTPVAALYGFSKELMPNLKVQVGFDERVQSREREKITALLAPTLQYISLC